jgi:hypothetical protein
MRRNVPKSFLALAVGRARLRIFAAICANYFVEYVGYFAVRLSRERAIGICRIPLAYPGQDHLRLQNMGAK